MAPLKHKELPVIWHNITLEVFNVQQRCCENLQSHNFQGSYDGLTEIVFWYVSGVTEQNQPQPGQAV
jgi:hypothetical protein